MRISDGDSFLELDELQRIPAQSPGQPDVRVSVAFRCGEFTGVQPSIWLEYPELDGFVSELRKLNESLSGKATIAAMSPGEFELEVFALDALGHVGLAVALGRVKHLSKGAFVAKTSGVLEIEASQLSLLLAWFEGLLSNVPNAA
jgi:hypothetical protein